jgi:hypothetical protein
MQISCFSCPKFRESEAPGDDVLLVLPGHYYAVLDGATDPTQTIINGVTSGRFAALTCAEAVSALHLRSQDAGDTLLDQVSASLQGALEQLEARGEWEPGQKPPSTTLALALETEDQWSFHLLGDSGLRLNGREEFIQRKRVDQISATARVTIYHLLQKQGLSGDELEQKTRQIIYYGLQRALAKGLLTSAEVESVEHAALALELAPEASVLEFLQLGIVTQHHWANRGDSPLGFATLNGGRLAGEGRLSFSRPKSEVRSIELFTDGYFTLPQDVDLQAWEEEFSRIEALDPHKLSECPAVKGSTTEEFSDDRTVLILRC